MGTEFSHDFDEHVATELLVDARRRCTPVLEAALSALPGPFPLMAGYQLGWWDSKAVRGNFRQGKSIRAALVFAAAQACGGTAADAVFAAAAIQLVHNFTLIHDDLIDDDIVRRGRPTVWSVWGKTNAILLGDALHAAAINLLTDAPWPDGMISAAIRKITMAATEACAGQFEDCAFETAGDIDTAAYLRMAMGKTGALVGCSCALGALCAGAEPAMVDALDRFGRELGMAFQFTDDLMGIWGDPEVTGKPAGADIARRKRTLPIVAALRSGTPEAAALGRIFRSKALLTANDIAHATALVAAAGGRTYTARAAIERAVAAVEMLPDRADTSALVALTSLAVHRDH
ncbi:polyprenyl synthetase family protein [Nocardia brasiliensis]|uniref:polyprenyl synthetase family protein n=1 Tax=Nocardia brasiliensis TaxID=37326 RepID=UPI003D907B27